MKKVLVTGHKNGIGRYIYEYFVKQGNDVVGWDRGEEPKIEEVDLIIHCAFNSDTDVTTDTLGRYVEDNILFTKKLVEIPHSKFVFFSTQEVYNTEETKEDAILDIEGLGLYPISKLMSESIAKTENSLILRCASLVGKYARKNTLRAIVEDKNPVVGLDSASMFNYIAYKDVLEFIKIAWEKGYEGIYNLASSDSMSLSEVADTFNKEVVFGEKHRILFDMENTKVREVYSAFRKTSKEVLERL